MYPSPHCPAAAAANNPGPESYRVKVIVNEDMCEGHGKCEMAAPEVFKLGPDDVSVVLIDDVPKELEDKVARAIRLCPRQAIAWETAQE